MTGKTRSNILGSILLVLTSGALLTFCTYLSSVPVGKPSNGVPVVCPNKEEEDDGHGPINLGLGLGTNEIDDFLGL